MDRGAGQRWPPDADCEGRLLNPFQPPGELFAPPKDSLAFAVASPTSRRAAKRAEPGAATIAARILSELRRQGAVGSTDDQLEIALQIPGNSLRGRRQWLEKTGRICRSNRERDTRTGSPAVVWVISGCGR